MRTDLHQIKNIIFDLGDVIIDLSIPGTIARLAERAQRTTDEVKSIYWTSEAFHKHEKGLLTDADFHQEANSLLGTNMSFEEFSEIWNSMLIRIPIERLRLLKDLSSRFRLFLLSNTNEIHLNRFTQMMEEVSPGYPLESYFEKAYYSHKVGMRKPDAEIFNFVVRENGLSPHETLFLDDNPGNIRGATLVGIQSLLIKNPSVLFELFK